MTLADLADYQPQWVDTISMAFAGRTVHQIPPNGQGIAALMALGMLEKLDVARFPADSVEAQHLQIEAMKLAFADTYRWVADSSAMTQMTVAHLLSDDYLAQRARLIAPGRAQDFAHGTPPSGGTVYLTAADEGGRMVSLIQSNYMGFGSGVVVPGTGVSLQNRGQGFTLEAGHPNVVAGGKRPFHTIIPGFLCDADGRPRMSFGVMGGNLQPQGHVQTLMRMLRHGQQPQAACDAPRWKVATGRSVDFEHTMAPALVAGLRALGHESEPTVDPYMDFGSGQFIWRLSDDPADGYVAASDSRRDGQAVGF
jgi:gamma-glutamyltranspeptidase / glutathione hydrolase